MESNRFLEQRPVVELAVEEGDVDAGRSLRADPLHVPGHAGRVVPVGRAERLHRVAVLAGVRDKSAADLEACERLEKGDRGLRLFRWSVTCETDRIDDREVNLVLLEFALQALHLVRKWPAALARDVQDLGQFALPR